MRSPEWWVCNAGCTHESNFRPPQNYRAAYKASSWRCTLSAFGKAYAGGRSHSRTGTPGARPGHRPGRTPRDIARSFTFMAHCSLTCLSIMACGFRRAAFRLKGKQKLICPYCVIIVKMDNPNINCGEGWIRNNDHKIMSLNHQSVIFNISF